MRILDTLPADARRALARKELVRRGLMPPLPSDQNDQRVGLRYSTDEELARMEELGTLYPQGTEQPPEVVAEWKRLLAAMVHRMREADADGSDLTEAEILETAERLERRLAG